MTNKINNIYNKFWDDKLGKSNYKHPCSPSMYENWSSLFEGPDAVTKKELEDYFRKNKDTKDTKKYHGSGEIFKCWNCSHSNNIQKNGISLDGNPKYVLTCKKEKVTVYADWDCHCSDLPCYVPVNLKHETIKRKLKENKEILQSENKLTKEYLELESMILKDLDNKALRDEYNKKYIHHP